MKTCQVCNSTKLVSLHHGIHACYSCYEFFTRYITTRIRRWLPCFQNCDVRKCRYCRLKKCLQAGMNRSGQGGQKFYNPKKYTNEDINAILHDANVGITETCIMSICKICCRETKSFLPLCLQCRDFFRKSKVATRRCKKEKDCKLHFTKPPLCSHCRYQKCLNIGWKKSIKKDEIMQVPKIDEPTRSDPIKPDLTVEFRKKRLAVACAIAEKENKFMCPDCLISFDNLPALFLHLRKPHIDNAERYSHLTGYFESDTENESDSDDFAKSETTTEDGIEYLEAECPKPKNQNEINLFECTTCEFKTHAKSTLSRHQLHWHLHPKHTCPECTIKFDQQWQLAFHLENQHQKSSKYHCIKCNQSHKYFRVFGDGRCFAYHWI